MTLEANEALGLHEMEHRHHGRRGHRDGGGPCRTGYPPPQHHDKQRVEEDVQHRAARHNPHALGRVAAGADKAREVEGDGGQEHARQHNLHILTRIADSVERGAEQLQDAVHEQIAARDKQDAEEKSQQHTVAQNLLGPAHILAAQHDAHAARRADAHQRAKRVDDVHYRHRDGQAGNGQRTHILPKEHTVDNIVYRRHHLRYHRRQRILPQQAADRLRFQFVYVVHNI